MDMFVGGEWTAGTATAEVRSPFSGDAVDTVPVAGPEDVERALATAVDGARRMAALPAHRRAELLEAAASSVEQGTDALAETITLEQGKTRAEAAAEASRIPGLLRLCAAEALRIGGELLPLDASPLGDGRLGFTLPEPCGVVVAISPFNYPAVLVVHKVGPALAAGNAVILKPATATPLTALSLIRHLVEAGLPPEAVQCITGPGADLGPLLVADRRVRKITFTGSRDVGARIAHAAGPKRLTCELGSNSALVVLDDADPELAATAAVKSGYINSGQNCISTQRVMVPPTLRDPFVERLVAEVDRLRLGDPADPDTTLGPVISDSEAERITEWIQEAGGDGGRLARGGERDGALVSPSVVVDPSRNSRLWRHELFGPAIAVTSFDGDDEALALANDTSYGLSMGVLTTDINRAMRFIRGLRSGMVHVNCPTGTTWRTDFVPYGGFGDSGYGKEGVKYAVREMTEEKLVVIHPS